MADKHVIMLDLEAVREFADLLLRVAKLATELAEQVGKDLPPDFEKVGAGTRSGTGSRPGSKVSSVAFPGLPEGHPLKGSYIDPSGGNPDQGKPSEGTERMGADDNEQVMKDLFG